MKRRTPTLSVHARQRCEEMGISTKVPKRIVRSPSVVRPGKPGSHSMVAVNDEFPDYAVVYDAQCLTIITVLFRTEIEYVRDGDRFRARDV